MTVSGVNIVVKAVIVFLGLVMNWRSSQKPLTKWLIGSIVILWAIGTGLDVFQQGKVTVEQSRQGIVQKQMADSLSTLKTNSETERKAKDAETARHKEITERLSALVARGAKARDTCTVNEPSPNERKWMADVETYLTSIDVPDAREFLNSSQIIPQQSCFGRIGGHLAVLENIMRKY